MYYTIDQVINGLVKYIDAEIMEKLPTPSKWIVGGFVGVLSTKAGDVSYTLQSNVIVQMMDIFDEEGNVDVDTLINSFKSSAEKYGRATFDVPMVGKMTFSHTDFDKLKTYIV